MSKQNIIKKRQFINVRDNRNLVYEKLEPMINNSVDFQEMFSSTDADVIANLLVKGWTKIIDELAPNKRIQLKNNNEDIISDEAKKLKSEHDAAIDRAITNKDGEEFRLSKAIKNKLMKTIEKDKARIMKKKLNHKKHKWKVIDSVDEKEDLIPTTITYNGETSSSPKRIGEILGEYFIKKVQDIRANFDDETEDAMKTFEYLIEKP